MKDFGLTVINLRKNYKRFQLGPINFRLDPGQSVGLLGANGGGKTTLLNCLAGQMSPSTGSVCWKDEEISLRNWKIREKIGFVTEYPTLYETVSARDHLLFASGVFENWDQNLAKLWSKKFELPLKQKVKEFSKGMKVKLSLLIAISHQAELLILDEPTSGLDPDTRFEIQQFFRELVDSRKICLILSSHLFEDIENITNDIKIIDKGKIIHEFEQDELRQYIYTETSTGIALHNPTIIDSSELWWERGSTLCHIMTKSGFEKIMNLNTFNNTRDARVGDIYFGIRQRNSLFNPKEQIRIGIKDARGN